MMNKWFTFLMLLPCWAMAQNYCSISKDHTMCKYQGSGPTCGLYKDSGVSQAEIQEILQLHNHFRAKIATGRENRGWPGPQPPAANMQELVWDDNLAAVAQKWADQCMFQHDACRNDPRFQVGQNMYFSSGFSKVDWTRAVSSWYEEVTRFNSRMVDSFQFQPAVGHYTQLMWGNTRYVGCGRVTFGRTYRLEGYRRMEYVLSTSPQNESDIDFEDENRRGFDIRPDIDDILTTVPNIIEDLEEQATHPFATTQAAEENTSGGTTTENIISTTSGRKEEKITKPATTTQTSEKNTSSETTTENSTKQLVSTISVIKEEKTTTQAEQEVTESSTEKIIPTALEIKELKTTKPSTTIQTSEENISGGTTTEKIISTTSGRKEEETTKSSTTTQASKENTSGDITTEKIISTTSRRKEEKISKPAPTKNSSCQNPKWNSDSQPNSKGQISGAFQSSKLAQYWDLNSFIIKTPPLQALKIPSWDFVHGRWYLAPTRITSNTAAKSPPRIQINNLTEKEWVQSNFDNLGRDQILVCNYGPAGNYLYQPIYIRGQPCSRCPAGFACRNGLCARK